MWTMSFFFVLLGVVAMVALWELRRWALRWGTTPKERTRIWQGDELSPYAIEISTRAVTIAAPLETVWSWLVQIGQDRAGFYSYTWLEISFDAPCHASIGSSLNGSSERSVTSSGWHDAIATVARRARKWFGSIGDACSRSRRRPIGTARTA